MIPKRPREENPHLRRMARKHGCVLRLVEACMGDDSSTTVLAHQNSLSAGKGMGLKAHDWRAVYACAPCHAELDQGRRLSKDEKKAAFEAAFLRQLALYQRISSDPLAKPLDVASAEWALARMAVSGP